MDPSLKRRWWLIGAAALLAGILLRDAFGSWTAAAVVAVAAASLAGYELSRRSRPSTLRCLNCGEALRPSARQCDSCGSASWTWKN